MQRYKYRYPTRYEKKNSIPQISKGAYSSEEMKRLMKVCPMCKGSITFHGDSVICDDDVICNYVNHVNNITKRDIIRSQKDGE